MDRGYNIKADGKVEVTDFLFKSQLNLRPLTSFWKSAAAEKEKMKSTFAETILQKLEEIPEGSGTSRARRDAWSSWTEGSASYCES